MSKLAHLRVARLNSFEILARCPGENYEVPGRANAGFEAWSREPAFEFSAFSLFLFFPRSRSLSSIYSIFRSCSSLRFAVSFAEGSCSREHLSVSPAPFFLSSSSSRCFYRVHLGAFSPFLANSRSLPCSRVCLTEFLRQRSRNRQCEQHKKIEKKNIGTAGI